MADEKAAGISFDLDFNLGKIKKSINDITVKVDSKLKGAFGATAKKCESSCDSMSQAFKDTSTDISKSLSEVDEKIKRILENGERSMKSKASSIAWIYRKEGMSQSDAMKKAWSDIDRITKKSTDSVKKKIGGIGQKSKDTAKGMEASFKSSFNMIALLSAAAFGTKKLIDFGKSCIDLGSDLAEVQNVVDVTFPSMSKQIDKFAKSAANQFGLSETMAKKFTGTFGSMAEAFGFTEKEAYKMSTALTGLAGDVASFYNISQDEAYTKLKSVFSGETETLKDLGVVMTQSALDSYALANSYGKVISEMTEAEKVSLRFAFVQSQLSNAAGDFARTSNSWANQTRILSLQFDSLKATIGQGLINAFTPVIKVVNILLAKVQLLANTFKKLTENFFGSAGSSSTEEAATTTSNAMDIASGASGTVAKNTKKAAKEAKKLQASVMGFDRLNKLNSKESNVSSENGSSGSVATTTTTKSSGDAGKETKKASKFEKLLGKLKKKFAPLTNAISNFVDAAKPLVGAFGKGILVFFKRFAKYIGEPAIKIAAKIINILASALRKIDPDIVQATATALCEVAAGILAIKIGKSTLKGLNSLKDKLKGLSKFQKTAIAVTVMIAAIEFAHLKWSEIFDKYSLEEIEQALHDMFSDIFGDNWFSDVMADWSLAAASFFEGLFEYSPKEWLDGIIGLTKETGQKIRDSVVRSAEKVKLRIKNTIDKVKEVFNKFNTFLSNVFKTDFSENFGALGEIVNGFKKNVENIWNSIKDTFKGIITFIKGVFTGDWEKAWTGVKDIFKGIFDGLVAIVKAPLNLIIGLINTMLSAIFDGVNWMIEKINKFSVDIPDFLGGGTLGFDINTIDASDFKIPYLANGGYVEANTPQLAMIGDNRHQGEVVAPENKLQSMVDSAVSQNTQAMLAALQSIFQNNNSGKNIELTVNVGNKKLMREVLRAANNENKRMGKTVYNV